MLDGLGGFRSVRDGVVGVGDCKMDFLQVFGIGGEGGRMRNALSGYVEMFGKSFAF